MATPAEQSNLTRCGRCGNFNYPNASQCEHCRTILPPTGTIFENAVADVKRYKTLFIALGCLVGVFMVIGLIGAAVDGLKQKPEPYAFSATGNARPSPSGAPSVKSSPVTVTATATVSPSPAPKIDAPTTTASKSAVKKATIIDETVDLRETPNDDGEFVETLSADETVEIVRQKGAWFLVKSGSASGWLHGNRIKLVAAEKSSATGYASDAPSAARSQQQITRPAAEINTSGASAKCRDGSLSYSQNRRGTCSHHGGVAVWY